MDLLTSILKSNLSDTRGPPLTAAESKAGNMTVNAAVKSLLDDIQYEILKQCDENKSGQRKRKSSGSETEGESGSEDEGEDWSRWESGDSVTKAAETEVKMNGIVFWGKWAFAEMGDGSFWQIS